MYSIEVWEKDKIKKDVIQKEGYDVKIIWESEYKQNREKVIEDCIEFLKN